MKLARRKYHPQDSLEIRPQPIFLENALASIEGLDAREGSFIETITADGKVIAILGLVVVWRGVASVWTVSSNEIKLYPKDFHVTVLAMIEEYARILKLWRLQFNVRATFKPGQRWAEALGFEREGRMKKYDPKGEDYFRYARIFRHG